jgi:hypothetical protein
MNIKYLITIHAPTSSNFPISIDLFGESEIGGILSSGDIVLDNWSSHPPKADGSYEFTVEGRDVGSIGSLDNIDVKLKAQVGSWSFNWISVAKANKPDDVAVFSLGQRFAESISKAYGTLGNKSPENVPGWSFSSLEAIPEVVRLLKLDPRPWNSSPILLQNPNNFWVGPGQPSDFIAGATLRAIRLKEIKLILTTCLKGRIKTPMYHLGDADYYLPSLARAQSVISSSSTSRLNWSRRFDCDDFAVRLKADFGDDANKHPEVDQAHAFGIAWGTHVNAKREVVGGHAINWMINDDLKVRFIEPQSGNIWVVGEKGQADLIDIYFFMA